MIRVLVAAAGLASRSGLEGLVRGTGIAEIVSSLGSYDGLDRLVRDRVADVVVADSMEAGEEGEAPVVIVGDDHSHGLPKPPVKGLLPRIATSEELRAALEAVQAGLVVVHPSLLDGGRLDGERLLDAGPVLTPREFEVLRMMSEGAANKEIAHRLGITEHTAKFHVSGIMEKLGAASRTEAVTRGIRQGLVLL